MVRVILLLLLGLSNDNDVTDQCGNQRESLLTLYERLQRSPFQPLIYLRSLESDELERSILPPNHSPFSGSNAQ